MAHFAEINADNQVLRVIVVADEHEANGAEWCNNLLGGTWIQTSYNNRIRKQYAGIGFSYDEEADVFVAPQPLRTLGLLTKTMIGSHRQRNLKGFILGMKKLWHG
jgi:hypothetical protein